MKTSTHTTIISLFRYYKSLGEKSIVNLTDEQIVFQYDKNDNSIGQIIKHLAGNMTSRFTDFYDTDGEKSWRNRDSEFVNPPSSKNEAIKLWESGWEILFKVLDPMTPADLAKIVYIRNQGHTVEEALLRQLAHYVYHIGQIIYLAKSMKGSKWQTLSIPKGKSQQYNQDKFSAEKSRRFFTE